MSQTDMDNSELPIPCIGYTIQSLKKKYNISVYEKSEIFTEDTTSGEFGENDYKNKNFFYISNDKNNNIIAINIKNDSIQSLSDYELISYERDTRNSPPVKSPTKKGYHRDDILAMEHQIKILTITHEYTLYVENTNQKFLNDLSFNYFDYKRLDKPNEKNQVKIELCHQSLIDKKIDVLRYSELNIHFESGYNKEYDIVGIDEYARSVERISEKSIYISFARIISSLQKKNEIIYEDYLLTFHYTWKVIRLIWLGFLKKNEDNDNNNNNNSFCYFSVLPKDLIKIIISFLHHMVFLS
jgi:hypothetical protein